MYKDTCRLFWELSRGGDFLWPEEPGNVSQKDKFLHPLEFSNLTINFLYQSLTEGQLHEQIYILHGDLYESSIMLKLFILSVMINVI